jgi:hypothetical protein
LKPAVYIHQQRLIPVAGGLTTQERMVLVLGTEVKKEQPVVKLPVKRAQIS